MDILEEVRRLLDKRQFVINCWAANPQVSVDSVYSILSQYPGEDEVIINLHINRKVIRVQPKIKVKFCKELIQALTMIR